jgi:hypothetical protein
MTTHELPLAIAGMADPVSYILGASPETMSDAQLKDLVEKTREFGSSPQAIKAALGESIGGAKKKKLALSADAIALAEQAGF